MAARLTPSPPREWPDEQDPGEVGPRRLRGRPPGPWSASGGPVGPAGEVLRVPARNAPARRRPRRAVLGVDAVRGDRHRHIALGGQQLLVVQVAAVAGDRLVAGRAGPVAGDVVLGARLVAGDVPAVQEQRERAACRWRPSARPRRACISTGVGKPGSATPGEVYSPVTVRYGPLTPGIDGVFRRLRRNSRERDVAQHLGSGHVQAPTGRADLQVVELRGQVDREREGALVGGVGPAEQPVAGIELDRRVTDRHQLRRGPGQRVAVDLPGAAGRIERLGRTRDR